MRGSNEKTLKEAIEQLLHAYRIKDKLDEVKLISSWEEIMGKAIANRTSELFIKNRSLYLRLESAALKKELMMMKTRIVEMLNEKAGKSIIDGVIFL